MNATYTRVHVPDGAAAAYRNVAGWNQFKIMEYAPMCSWASGSTA